MLTRIRLPAQMPCQSVSGILLVFAKQNVLLCLNNIFCTTRSEFAITVLRLQDKNHICASCVGEERLVTWSIVPRELVWYMVWVL